MAVRTRIRSETRGLEVSYRLRQKTNRLTVWVRPLDAKLQKPLFPPMPYDAYDPRYVPMLLQTAPHPIIATFPTEEPSRSFFLVC